MFECDRVMLTSLTGGCVIFCFFLCFTSGAGWADGSPGPGVGSETACIGIPQTRSDQTPVDLNVLVKAYAAAGDGARAFMLFSLSAARVHFDAGRFKDKHAYRIAYALKERAVNQFSAADQSLIGRGSAEIVSSSLLDVLYCAQLRSAPPPTYQPTYMAALFADPTKGEINDRLKPDFDPESAWAAEVESLACARE